MQQYEQNNPFICNICLEIASEPVITNCGHLYWFFYFIILNESLVGHAFIKLKFIIF